MHKYIVIQMSMEVIMFHALADNLTYGSSPGDAMLPSKEDPSLLKASMYEVPLSAVQSIGGSTAAGHDYELSGSFYAVPNMYEYATLGPNGAMVIHFVLYIFGNCSIRFSKECFQTVRKLAVIVSLSLFAVGDLCGFMCMTLFDLSPGSELRTPILSIR